MTASLFRWTTPQRASRLLRAITLLLMVLIAVAAIYALTTGGVGRDVLVLRDDETPAPHGDVTIACTATATERHCSRTERDTRPGQNVLPPANAAPQHGAVIKASLLIAAPNALSGNAARVVRSTIDLSAPVRGVSGALLPVLTLLLVLGILFNLERLLHALETASVFSEGTVRRLQLTGVFVAALGFLPQIDIFALLRNAVLSLVTPLSVGPLPLIAGGGIDIALILAGVFTVLMARVVHEAIALAEDLRGTV